MNTKNFNFIDKTIAIYRLGKVLNYVKKNDVILDFGCGYKSFLLDYSKNKIMRGVGLDYDVKNHIMGNVQYMSYKFNNGKLPFKDNYFDKIFLLAVLEHIEGEQVLKLFTEFKRVLKEKGQIIITTPTLRGKSVLEFLAFKLKIISREEILDHKKYYSLSDLRSLSNKVKLKLLDYKLFQLGINSRAVFKK